ncbi:hypothetical protein JCM6882_003677 [Rhodosporidiobolus microsporus]
MSNPAAPSAAAASSRGPLPPYLISNTPPTPSRSPSNASASGNDDGAEGGDAGEDESADESDFPEGDDADPDASTLSLSKLSPALATPKPMAGSPWPFNAPGGAGGPSLMQGLMGGEEIGAGGEEDDHPIPASSLPHEILLHILRLLPGSSLAPALRVCKAWCQCGVELLWHKPIFKTLPSLYRMLQVLSLPAGAQTFPYPEFVRRLNFNNLHHEMSDRMLHKLLPCRRIERLTLTGCKGLTSAAMVALLSQSKRLIALDLSDVENVDDAVLEAMAKNCPKLQGLNMSGCARITDRGLEQLALGCPALRRIKLRKCESITDVPIILLSLHCPLLLEVDLAGCSAITSLSVMQLLRTSRALRELSLLGCGALTDEGFPDAETLQLLASPASAEASYLPPLPFREDGSSIHLIPSSEALPSASSANGTTPTARPPIDLSTKLLTTTSHLLPIPLPLRGGPALKPFDHLRYLDVTSCAQLTDASVAGIVKYAPRLRNLILAKCVRLTDEAIYAICGVGKHLHYLHLGHVGSITDRAVIALARACTRLRYIDLACCNNLTDLSVTELAANLPRLKRIGLVRVTSITDASLQSLHARTSLERIHLSYCDNLSVAAVNDMLQSLPRLTHLSLTGVSAFRKRALQVFCRPPPRDFNDHQRRSFCVFSGRGVQDLRKFLRSLTPTELAALALPDPTPDLGGATDPATAAAFAAAQAAAAHAAAVRGAAAGGAAGGAGPGGQVTAQQLAQNQARLAQIQQARATLAVATARLQAQQQAQQQALALAQQQQQLHQHQQGMPPRANLGQPQPVGAFGTRLPHGAASAFGPPPHQPQPQPQLQPAHGWGTFPHPHPHPHQQHPHHHQHQQQQQQGQQGQRAGSAPAQPHAGLTNGNLLGLQHGGSGGGGGGGGGGDGSSNGPSSQRLRQTMARLDDARRERALQQHQQQAGGNADADGDGEADGDVNVPVRYVAAGSASSFGGGGFDPHASSSARMSAPPAFGDRGQAQAAYVSLRRIEAVDGERRIARGGEASVGQPHPQTPRNAAMDLDMEVEVDVEVEPAAGSSMRATGGRARGATVTRENFAAVEQRRDEDEDEEDGGSGSASEGEEEDISMGDA